MTKKNEEEIEEEYFKIRASVIKIKKCKKEGITSEIFIPGYGLGKAKNIEKLLDNAIPISKEEFEDFIAKHSH